jgi:hypothetical protein
MRNLTATIIACAMTFTSFAQDFTSEADAFFNRFVQNGQVDYASIKKEPSMLNALVQAIGRAPQHPDEEEKAFLINAYNIMVIQGVMEHYPVSGPLAIDGFFDANTFAFRGQKCTLNRLEKEILYKTFPDARLHFVLVCAAKDCPPLASYAFTAKLLERQLEERTRMAINNPSFIRISNGKMQVSQLFEWYAQDFGGQEKTVTFIRRYHGSPNKVPSSFTFYPYDWSLNGR